MDRHHGLVRLQFVAAVRYPLRYLRKYAASKYLNNLKLSNAKKMSWKAYKDRQSSSAAEIKPAHSAIRNYHNSSPKAFKTHNVSTENVEYKITRVSESCKVLTLLRYVLECWFLRRWSHALLQVDEITES